MTQPFWRLANAQPGVHGSALAKYSFVQNEKRKFDLLEAARLRVVCNHSIKNPNKEIQMFKRITASTVLTAFLAGLIASLVGCNTMHGAGEDIEKGGEKIQEKADEHR
jgi:predicted small secreted protein